MTQCCTLMLHIIIVCGVCCSYLVPELTFKPCGCNDFNMRIQYASKFCNLYLVHIGSCVNYLYTYIVILKV